MKPCKKSNASLKDGYPQLNRKTYGFGKEARYLYAKYHGVTLTPKDEVRHLCDNRWCVEITHLVLGTHADNMRDKRGKRGAPNLAKLTEEDVRQIRSLAALGMSTWAISKEYPVKERSISRILDGTTWKHVK